MKIANRWLRFSQIIQYEINEILIHKKELEYEYSKLEDDCNSLKIYLNELAEENHTDKPNINTAFLLSKRNFYESLTEALDNQYKRMSSKEQQIENLRIKIQALYTKQKSYELLDDKEKKLKFDKNEKNILKISDEFTSQQVIRNLNKPSQ